MEIVLVLLALVAVGRVLVDWADRLVMLARAESLERNARPLVYDVDRRRVVRKEQGDR